MTIKRNGVLAILATLLALALAIWVWPTQWAYFETGFATSEGVAAIDARVNRFTGRVEALTISGWTGPTAAPVAPAALPGPGMAPAVPTPE